MLLPLRPTSQRAYLVTTANFKESRDKAPGDHSLRLWRAKAECVQHLVFHTGVGVKACIVLKHEVRDVEVEEVVGGKPSRVALTRPAFEQTPNTLDVVGVPATRVLPHVLHNLFLGHRISCPNLQCF